MLQRLAILLVVILFVGAIGLFFVTSVNIGNNQIAEVPQNSRFGVIKEEWRIRLQTGDTAAAYQKITSEIPTINQDTHTLAHLLGEILYEEKKMDGLEFCNWSFGFGCYHGFFNSVINERGIEILPELDDACKEAYGDIDTRCQHGLGHGLLVYAGYENLTDALQLCDTVSSASRYGCTSGVFMEYNFHTMEKPGEEFFRQLEDGLYSPCADLPENYQASCYQEQTAWWAKNFNNDFQYMGELCSGIPTQGEIQDSCFRGIGNTITEQVAFDLEKIMASCDLMPDSSAAVLCREGSTWLMIGRKDQESSFTQLCESLAEEDRAPCRRRFNQW